MMTTLMGRNEGVGRKQNLGTGETISKSSGWSSWEGNAVQTDDVPSSTAQKTEQKIESPFNSGKSNEEDDSGKEVGVDRKLNLRTGETSSKPSEENSEVGFGDLSRVSSSLLFVQMEALYSKLYDKYTKLKTEKGSKIDEFNREQEAKFMNYVSAAEELIEHLRNENGRLHGQINDLRSEVASIRYTKDNQLAEYQKLLMEESQKSTKLLEEIEGLKNLQLEGLCCSAREDKIENEQLHMSGSLQIGSDILNDFDVNVTRKRSRDDGTTAEVMMTPCTSDPLECALVSKSASDIFTQIVSSGTGLNIVQPECCRRKIDLSGGINLTGDANCMFQDLLEWSLGMKLSTATQTEGKCISALHQSSGYSFSLTRVNKGGTEEEVELVYSVLSLGAFERVAPEWMREVIMFSVKMCPIFFERVSRVIKLSGGLA
ncbi:hypothetical protein TEA_023602 [Camellia sinensis var. sinensis]|uniref:DUF7806 domain-containing protein n=2 Tax=Camellia sinensis TaxID=4442 RepID=A0A4S4EW96_CAMSN|nr:hypothetical protein TEA_023602 [Camellia sinensis var. sinensis]